MGSLKNIGKKLSKAGNEIAGATANLINGTVQDFHVLSYGARLFVLDYGLFCKNVPEIREIFD
ncbi:hypothetical protein [Metabacillus elymi]|uniref:Uncharacterized protein n=1 Tax=Metabacillus elymi TaxID=2745198 RepID=A0ABX6S6I7_9BACI|nr:hypothetical protein [Metabacillus sp. KUDC1714]QNF28520.1 hypothetical protein HUW50_14150 [Metabacillus sp. KUDC1714]